MLNKILLALVIFIAGLGMGFYIGFLLRNIVSDLVFIVLFFVFFLTSLFLFFYVMHGKIEVLIINDTELQFRWKKKLLFNHAPIETIQINEIKKIVTTDLYVQKIICEDRVVNINSMKSFSDDNTSFTTFLRKLTEDYPFLIIESMDLVSKKYKKIMTVLICLILLAAIIAIVYAFMKGHINWYHLSMVVFMLPMLLRSLDEMNKNKKQ